MEDPGQFGAELVDRTVARMETDWLDSAQAALLALKTEIETNGDPFRE